MDKKREEFIKEINRLKEARSKTKSSYLIKDYTKAIKEMEQDLVMYDRFRKEAKKLK